MFEGKKILKKIRDVGVFFILGASLPVFVGHLFGEELYLKVLPMLYCLFIVAYVCFFPLYHRMVEFQKRRWWKFMLLFIGEYLAVVGVYLLFLLVR